MHVPRLSYTILLVQSLEYYVRKTDLQYCEVEQASSLDSCLLNFEEGFILGKWLYFGYDTETPPYFIFDKNKQFELFDWIEKGYRIEGEWELVGNNEAIKLKFYNLDNHWEKLLDDNLYDYFDRVYEYDKEKKEIAFKLGYFEREEDFSGECKEDRFYIDLFNIYLYKDEIINYTLDELKECWNLIEINLVGRWEYVGGELEEIPYIDFYENGDFIANA